MKNFYEDEDDKDGETFIPLSALYVVGSRLGWS